jgi:hypothetical protein
LLNFTAMDFNRPLVTFRRRNQAGATHLHVQIRSIVTQEKEEDWCAFCPSPRLLQRLSRWHSPDVST